MDINQPLETLDLKENMSSIKPKGVWKQKIDYSSFSDPDSVKEFEECKDFTKFDFNTFLNKNPKIQRYLVKEAQTFINEQRGDFYKRLSKDSYPNDLNLCEGDPYLIDQSHLYSVGVSRIFASLRNGTEFDIDELNKTLLEEVSSVINGDKIVEKPVLFGALRRVYQIQGYLMKHVDKFPKFENGGVKKRIQNTLEKIQDFMVKLLVRGYRAEVSDMTIKEAILNLRISIDYSRRNKYFDSNTKLENDKRAIFCLRLCSELERLCDAIKEGTKKKPKTEAEKSQTPEKVESKETKESNKNSSCFDDF